MSQVGQRERETQTRIIKLFSNVLNYRYLGNWYDRPENSNIASDILTEWLIKRNIDNRLIPKVFRELERAASIGQGRNLYDANKDVYSLLRYGVKVKPEAGASTETVWLIDWNNPENNDFAIAEEVTVLGKYNKRPDLVIYINGIAVVILELKRSCVSVSEGIRQNRDNQKKEFIQPFFSTMQLVMAGNDSEGLRYGTIETTERYYLRWKEENLNYNAKLHAKEEKYLPSSTPEYNILDNALRHMLNKARLLELIHDFIVFDAGIKKTCRHNQFFGIQSARKYIQRNENGIIWHTQGSGKSLTMVWLAKWIRENIQNSRVLIVTDRTELDEQIEKVFSGVQESIYRTKSGSDLLDSLEDSSKWLLCSLVHKFGSDDEDYTDDYIAELKQSLSSNFHAQGNFIVFVDECHRTQSGKLHQAMKAILPNALFIGFTGTPLLKEDKLKSVEIFGSYIHTYKFDQAVKDGVVLDIKYEARDIDQNITSPEKIDRWFETKTAGLSDMAKFQLKQKWGTLKKVYSSEPRLKQIVNDILFDMETRTRLMDGRGNAMLVCSSIFQACKVYELFSQTDLAGKCAIITSYKPSPSDIKGEDSGEGATEKLRKYSIYRKMLADYFGESEDTAMYKIDEFEKQVKKRFIKEPGQMRLLIVMDKLLTGFDAPSATYLYIDKKMQDHGLFQAICRVNRPDGEDKEYGYVIDYKDLFHHIEGAIESYTSGAFEGYDSDDVRGLLTDRLQTAKKNLEEARERIKAICESVPMPQSLKHYVHYFCGTDTTNKDQLKDTEPRRVALYRSTASLIRAYTNIANEMGQAGYISSEIKKIKEEVMFYEKIRAEIKIASGDYLDMKIYEPAMRHLLDSYIRSEESEKISELDDFGLIDLIVERGQEFIQEVPSDIRNDPDVMAEAIENNMRRIITDEQAVNPKYYETMSELLNSLIRERREGAINYANYLRQIEELALKVKKPEQASGNYPISINTAGKRALYDNLGRNEDLVIRIDAAVRHTKKDSWVGSTFKEREVANAIRIELGDQEHLFEEILNLVKQQNEYQ
ncbi:type I restriction endonuclease subunit R [Legionella pneumophila]